MDQACCKVVLLTRMRIHPDIGTISSHPQALIEAESRLKKRRRRRMQVGRSHREEIARV